MFSVGTTLLLDVVFTIFMRVHMSEPPTNTDLSVFIRILKLITDEKLKNTDD